MYLPLMTSESNESGKCVHFQPTDLCALAEQFLQKAGIPEADWEGRRFHWGGNIDSPPFQALVLGCTRRQGHWVITRLDRKKEPITAADEGFRAL